MDDELGRAFRRTFDLAGDTERVDRQYWTWRRWWAEADRLMDDPDESVMCLLNGHVMALLKDSAELERLRAARQRVLALCDLAERLALVKTEPHVSTDGVRAALAVPGLGGPADTTTTEPPGGLIDG